MKKMNRMNNSKKAIILLSGGLDSLVSLSCAIAEGIDVKLALTFDYGQKSFDGEFQASQRIAEFYGFKHKIIKLDWLKEITNTSLVSNKPIPQVSETDLSNENITKQSMKNVWVPNRNGLFLNIAASYCDSLCYDYIILGANLEEAQTFSDNSLKFVESINKALETSTNYDIKLFVPLISLTKNQILKKGIELKAPLEFVHSCYSSTEKHCGSCESCNRLKRALKETNNEELFKRIFR